MYQRFFAALAALMVPGTLLSQGVWEKTYKLGSPTSIHSIKQVPDGGYIMAGWGAGWFGGLAEQNAIIMRLNSNGDTLWYKIAGGSQWDGFYAVVRDNDGGFVAAGETQSFGAGAQEVLLMKFDSLGNKVWD